MTVDTKYKSGKSERDEVSRRVSLRRAALPRTHTGVDRFARAADDAADNPKLDAKSKLAIPRLLKTLSADPTLRATRFHFAQNCEREILRRMLDLLKAFRQDVAKPYNTWSELIHPRGSPDSS